jgi:5-methyltetrahydrofolate--homocysteine methyltransferase
MGLQSGDAPELWNVTTPTGSPRSIAARWRRVGPVPDQLLRRHAARLKLHDAQDRVFELNKRKSAEIGREVADAAGPHGDRRGLGGAHGRDHGAHGQR